MQGRVVSCCLAYCCLLGCLGGAAATKRMASPAGALVPNLVVESTTLLDLSRAQEISAALRALNSSAARFQKPYNVCTSDWAPMVMCADKEDPADFSGFQIALWREIAHDMGWADSDWSFSCVDWTAMIDDLVDPNGSCSFAAAAVEVSLPNIVLGLKFSWPIYKSGFHVLIASAVEQGGTWAFAEAFHWGVWVVLGATAITVALLITLAETFTFGNHANRKGLRGWSWYSMGKMVQVPTHVGDPKTWASKALVLGYAFLALIMVHLFTATTANKMTMQRLANDITSKADLPGKKVISWEPYLPLLRKYSIDADALPWDNDDDTAAMLAKLRSHHYQALVLDSPVVQYFAAQAEQCDLFPVGDPFETFNLAIAFPPDVPLSLPQNITASIVRLQTDKGLLDELENVYVKGAASHGHAASSAASRACSNAYGTADSGGHGGDEQIHMKQVMGLWIIMGMSLGVSAVLTAAAWLQVLLHKHRGIVAPGEQQPGGAAQDSGDERDGGSASARPSVELPASLKAKLAARCGHGGPAGVGVAAAAGSGSHRSDAIAEVSLAAALGKDGSSRAAPPAVSGLRASKMQQQQQQVPRLAAELFSPTRQGPGRAAHAAAAQGGASTPCNASETTLLSARQVAPEYAQSEAPQQGDTHDDNEDSVLML
ncbi:hypothetical protein COO60DRAFT_30052 [Scenedesmus sp. NREL 46B-D3]|nr:hypothetical protein COO60DRAFT_30052 [Scenedesmus sp. NREL 46B-D3]